MESVARFACLAASDAHCRQADNKMLSATVLSGARSC